MSTAWAFREAHKIAGRKLILPFRVAQGGRSGQDQQPLLPPIHVVVGLRSLSGIKSTTVPSSRSAPRSGPSFAAGCRDPVGACGSAACARTANAFTAGCGGELLGSRTISTDTDGPAVPSPCQ